MKIHQKQNSIKLRKMRKRKGKIHFLKKVCSVKSKNESALERIRGYQGEMQIHLGKMEVCQIEKNAVVWKPIKFQKSKIKNQKRKRKKKRAR